MSGLCISTSGQTVVRVEDFAVFLMILKFFSANINEDGSLPVARWRRLWNSLFRCGDIDRAFCTQRFSVIRNHLSELGLLAWQEQKYYLGWTDLNGEYHKGKACKWKATETLMEMLETGVKEGEASFVRSASKSQPSFESKEPSEEAVRPILAIGEDKWRLNPEEIARFITPIHEMIGLAA